MDSTIAFTCLLGVFLPLILLYFNKGYLTANRYLAIFLFVISLYVLKNFYFFYGESVNRVAFFTCVHAFFYLISPFAFFYMRSILRDNASLSKTDYFHFALFVLSFLGYIPYLFSSWDYKNLVASNLLSENWDTASFHLNSLFPHKIDQALHLLQAYFYSMSLWYLVWYYKKKISSRITQSSQYPIIRRWLLVFACIFTIITINFTVVMAHASLYDDKSIFLNRASETLLFASLVYIGMNMVMLLFPHILYGLPLDVKVESTSLSSNTSAETNPFLLKEREYSWYEGGAIELAKNELNLFTTEYRKTIEAVIESFKKRKEYLNPNFTLKYIANESSIPAHHLTYFYNDIKKVSFTDWRNSLRIEEAKNLISQGETDSFTLQSISFRCGFSSQNTFIRAFKNATGTTPSTYLKSVSSKGLFVAGDKMLRQKS